MAFQEYCGIFKLVAIFAILGLNLYDPISQWLIKKGKEFGIKKDLINVALAGFLIYVELTC